MNKDLNLFTAYKDGSSKIGGQNNKWIIILISSFVVLILGTYGTLFLLKSNFKYRTNEFNERLNDDANAEDNAELASQINKNSLLRAYNGALKTASENFYTSRYIDNEVLSQISSSMPKNVTISSLKISPQSIQMSCSCSDRLDPARFAQALSKKPLLKDVFYDGVSSEFQDDNAKLFYFNISCNFKEKEK